MTLEINPMIDANAPVGVFDSGVGGLTVVREIMRQIPNEKITDGQQCNSVRADRLDQKARTNTADGSYVSSAKERKTQHRTDHQIGNCSQQTKP